MMEASDLKRRAVTVPIGIIAILFVYAFALPALVVALPIDLVRGRKKHFMTMRIVCFIVAFAVAETGGLSWLLASTLFAGFGAGRAARLLRWDKRLQKWWSGWLLHSGRVLLELKFVLEGEECLVADGPLIAFCNHTSLVDTMMPSVFLTHRNGIYLRIILKDELRLDPALDICASRMGNYFAKRGRDTSADLRGVRALADGLGPKEAVCIFPEGTRFKASRRERALERVRERDPALYERAVALKNVMPPRPGGILTLLEAEYDVVFFIHRGLDGMAGLKELWSGRAVGKTVDIKLWRVAHTNIPTDPKDRMNWFYDEWTRVNDWIGTR